MSPPVMKFNHPKRPAWRSALWAERTHRV